MESSTWALHLARGQRTGQLQQAISQRGFAMIDMSNDGKIAEKGGVHGCSGQSLILTGGHGRQPLLGIVALPRSEVRRPDVGTI
jgi:hypothetical protein